MNKKIYIIGKLQKFFANNDSSKATNSISAIMNSIRIQSKITASPPNYFQSLIGKSLFFCFNDCMLKHKDCNFIL